jgi:hypothetical protein
MTITRLKRKKLKNKLKSKDKKNKLKNLKYSPVEKKIDIEKIKKEFKEK